MGQRLEQGLLAMRDAPEHELADDVSLGDIVTRDPHEVLRELAPSLPA